MFFEGKGSSLETFIRDYLASLKEREELDAILPDLLSELGFTVYSRPGRGTTQHGVDVAAVGAGDDGENKVYLFSIKQGDLTRKDWDGGSLQDLRPSLNEIQDAYIPSRIPKEYEHLRIVICLCFGGDMQEQVRPAVTGYIEQHTTERISFEQWNGDKLAGLILLGILREEILPKSLRSSFQKAVAMVDEPDVAFIHFSTLVRQLRNSAVESAKARVTSARQIYVCLWILFVWARDVGNVEAPYRASEVALLSVWDLARSIIGKKTNEARDVTAVLHQLIALHLIISDELTGKMLPYIEKRDALSTAVNSRSSTDVNLKLFDLLGRIAMRGLWFHWMASQSEGEETNEMRRRVTEWASNGFRLIQANRILFTPLCDQQAIEIALFLLLAAASNGDDRSIPNWLTEMVHLLDVTFRTHGKYPCVFVDYRDIVEHPRDRSDEYFREATSGSILIPLLAAWLSALGETEAVEKLATLVRSTLAHCTLQLWLPDSTTEEKLYVGGQHHGLALSDLPFSNPGDDLLGTIAEACERENSFSKLSPSVEGYWPIILLACRHYRLPVPPHYWIELLRPASPAPEAASTSIEL
ncbi:MAG: chemotaxis protein [Pseudomonadota bacterium]